MLNIGGAKEGAAGNTADLLGLHLGLTQIEVIGILLDQLNNVRVELLGIKRDPFKILGFDRL
jgi:hypothetical protein